MLVTEMVFSSHLCVQCLEWHLAMWQVLPGSCWMNGYISPSTGNYDLETSISLWQTTLAGWCQGRMIKQEDTVNSLSFFGWLFFYHCLHKGDWSSHQNTIGENMIAHNAGYPGSIPGSGESSGEGSGYWRTTVHGISKSQTWLNDWQRASPGCILLSVPMMVTFLFLGF